MHDMPVFLHHVPCPRSMKTCLVRFDMYACYACHEHEHEHARCAPCSCHARQVHIYMYVHVPSVWAPRYPARQPNHSFRCRIPLSSLLLPSGGSRESPHMLPVSYHGTTSTHAEQTVFHVSLAEVDSTTCRYI